MNDKSSVSIWNSQEIVKVYFQRGKGVSPPISSHWSLHLAPTPGNLPRDQSPWKEAHAFLSRLFPHTGGALPPFLISDIEVKITIPSNPRGTNQNLFIGGKFFCSNGKIIIRIQMYPLYGISFVQEKGTKYKLFTLL